MLSKALTPANTDAKKMALVGRSERYKLNSASIDRMIKKLTKAVGPA